MKRFTTTMLAAVFALTAGALAAQDNPRPEHPQDRPPDVSQPSSAQSSATAGTFSGTISQVDQSGQSFTLKDSSGQEVTIYWDQSTRVMSSDASQASSSPSALKSGDEVVVKTTSQGGKNVASTVQVRAKKSSS
jgi:hypothetical protein